jgi:hypothetical protein
MMERKSGKARRKGRRNEVGMRERGEMKSVWKRGRKIDR